MWLEIEREILFIMFLTNFMLNLTKITRIKINLWRFLTCPHPLHISLSFAITFTCVYRHCPSHGCFSCNYEIQTWSRKICPNNNNKALRLRDDNRSTTRCDFFFFLLVTIFIMMWKITRIFFKDAHTPHDDLQNYLMDVLWSWLCLSIHRDPLEFLPAHHSNIPSQNKF